MLSLVGKIHERSLETDRPRECSYGVGRVHPESSVYILSCNMEAVYSSSVAVWRQYAHHSTRLRAVKRFIAS